MFKLLLLGLLLIVSSVTSENYKKLNIDFLYSNTNEWTDFVQNQLYPSYNRIENYIHVTFIPFYNQSESTEANQFVLNGETPSKIELCELNALKTDHQSQISFLKCYHSYEIPKPTSVDCLHKNLGNIFSLNECYDGEVGTALIQNTENKLKSQNTINKLPAVIFNNEYDELLNRRAFNGFLTVVCEQLEYSHDKCNQL